MNSISSLWEQLTKSLASIQKVSTKLSSIVKGIKTLAHSGEKLEKEKVLFHEIVEDSEALIQLKNKEVGAQIEIDLDKGIEILGNKVQFGQVVINLMTNALDAISQLEEKCVKITAKEEKDHFFIYVIDSGSGIPEIEARKIFDEFYTTKAVGKGTGLGLSVVKKIAMEHMGDFFLDKNSPNTSFCLVLPKYVEED